MIKTDSNEGGFKHYQIGKNIVTVLKAVLFCYLLVMPLFILLAGILTFTDFPEKLLMPGVIIAVIVSVLIGSMSITLRHKEKGWILGSVTGIIYVFILYLVSSMVYNNYSMTRYTITLFVIGILAGSIGSILGLNTSMSLKRKKTPTDRKFKSNLPKAKRYKSRKI